MALNYETATAAEMAAAVAARDVSAAELTEAAIAAIERLDGPINAVVVRDFDRARAQAAEADARIARGDVGTLAGVPMTVKDSHDVAGLPTTWGIAQARANIASEDSLAVQRLKGAGAVILGKSNIPPGLSDWQSDNPIYGRTNNPHDLERTAGGSSGGGAAAVAAGMVPLELGSDIGGSIRIPAHFCGVFGHKPSYALVPLRGHPPPGAGLRAPPPLSVTGPLARSAQDLDISLGVIAGPDPLDEGVGYALALPAPRHARLADYRVLILDSHPVAQVDSEILAALETAAKAAEAAGAKVSRGPVPLPDLGKLHRTYVSMLTTVVTRRAGDTARVISAHDWMDRVDEQTRLRKALADLFGQYDVILAPAFGAPAFPHTSEPDWRARSMTIDGQPTAFGNQLAWAGLATLGCVPATIVPAGRMKDGLPIGLQVIGPYLEDRTAIGFAGLLREAQS